MGKSADGDHNPDPNDLLNSIGCVIVDGRYLLAEELASGLNSVAQALANSGLAHLEPVVADAAGIVLQNPSDRAPVGSRDPLRGYYQKYPIWSFLVDPAIQSSRPLDGFRALTLARLLLSARDADPLHRLVGSVRPTLVSLESSAAETARVRQLDDAVRTGLRTQDLTQALGLFNQLASALQIPPQVTQDVRRLLELPPPPRPVTRPPTAQIQPQPIGPSADFLMVPVVPTDFSSDSEDAAAPEVAVAKSALLVRGRLAAAREIVRATAILKASLDPSSDQYLSEPETKYVVNLLCARAHSHRDQQDILAFEVCLSVLCSFVTTRDLEFLWGAPSPGEDPAFLFSPNFSEWKTRVPASDAFWKDDACQPGGNTRFPVPAEETWLPCPIELTTLLKRLASQHSRGGRLFSSPVASLRMEFQRLRAELRLGLAQRISQNRIRLCVPIRIVEQTGDISLAQIVAGQRLGQSDAPLHYYRISPQQARSRYRCALAAQTGLTFGATDAVSDERWVGSTTAAFPDAIYQEFTAALISDAGTAALSVRTSDWRKRRLNAVTRYTAWLLAAASGHRANKWLLTFSLLHSHPSGWAVVRDKDTLGVGPLRVVALPDLVLRQINILRILQLEFAEQLEALGQNPALAAARRLRDSAHGRAHFFCWIDGNNEAVDLDASELASYWLPERGLPANFLRARLRSRLAELGVHPQWISWQLGHEYLDRIPFADECLYSVPHFVGLLKGQLQSALEADGWKAIPSTYDRLATLGHPEPDLLETDIQGEVYSEIEQLRRAWRDRQQLPYQKDFVLDAKAESAASAWADSRVAELHALGQRRDSPTVQITESMLDGVISDLSATGVSVDELDLRLRRLSSRLRSNYRLKKWTGPPPPRVFRWPFVTPTLVTAHVKAAFAMDQLRSVALDRKPNEASVAADLLGSLAVVICSDGIAATPGKLKALLAALALNGDPDGDLDRVFIDLQVSPSSTRGYALSKEATGLARRWLQLKPAAPTNRQIALSVQKLLAPRMATRTLSSVLDALTAWGSVASAATVPGLIGSMMRSEDPQTLSSRDTMALLRGEIAAEILELVDLPGEHPSLDEQATGPELSTSVENELRQYGVLTAALSKFSGSTYTQGIKHHRFTEVRELAHSLIANPLSTGNVRLLCRYVVHLLDASSRGLEVRSAYTYITSVGKRLLLSAGGRYLGGCEEDVLSDIYEDVLESVRQSTKGVVLPDVAARLIDFHYCNEASLPDADLGSLAAAAGRSAHGAVRVGAVSPGELDLMKGAFIDLALRGHISADERDMLDAMLDILYDEGGRFGEVAHLRIRDIGDFGDAVALHVRASPQGTLKTKTSRRTAISNGSSTAWVESVRKVARRRLQETTDTNAPLFACTSPVRFVQLKTFLRRALVAATGGRCRTFHLFRHGKGSRDLSTIAVSASCPSTDASARPLSAMQSARALGHGGPRTTRVHYWHLSHVAHALLQRWTKPHAAALIEGVTTSAIRQRRRRGSGGSASRLSMLLDQSAKAAHALDPQLVRHVAVTAIRDSRAPRDAIFQLVTGLAIDGNVDRNLARNPVTQSQLEKLVELCHELAFERQTALLPLEIVKRLEREGLGRDKIVDAPGRTRRLSITKLAASRATASTWKLLSGWARDDLIRVIVASSKSVDSQSAREKALIAMLGDRDDLDAVPFVAAAELISSAAI